MFDSLGEKKSKSIFQPPYLSFAVGKMWFKPRIGFVAAHNRGERVHTKQPA
jgi:hypothetical protein